MRTRPPLWAAATLLWLVPIACDGGGGGGGGAPPARPNAAPQISVPSTITGIAPSYVVVVPTTVSRSFLLSASDADGDRLTWQVAATGPAVVAVGLNHNAPAPDGLLLLHLVATSVPASAEITVLVEDGHGGSAAIELRIVRSGPPQLYDVQPRSAFVDLPRRVKVYGSALSLGGPQPVLRFGGELATDVATVNAGLLTAKTPTGTQPGLSPVRVTHPYGSDTLDNVFRFHAFPPTMPLQDRRVGVAADVTGFDVARHSVHVHVVATHGLTAELAYQRSDDGGVTWAPVMSLDGLETPSEPVVIADNQGPAIAWVGDGSSVWFRRLPGLAIRIDGTNNAPKAGLRLARGDQRFHAVWIEGDAVAGTARVVHATSANGVAWTVPQVVAPGPSSQGEPSLGAAAGSAWIVFTDDRLGTATRGVYAVRSSDAGSTWSPAQRLADTQGAVLRPLAASDGTRVHVAWLQQNGLRHCTSPDGGATWTWPAVVADGFDGQVGEHAIACSAERVALAYSAGAELRLARQDHPDGPLLTSRVDAEPAASGDPTVQIAGDYVYVAWREGAASASSARVRVAVSGDGGATFAWRSGFGDGFAAQRKPRLVHDDTRFAVVWIDDRDGPPFLYTNLTWP
jgi:hypothetical protein